VIRFNHISKEYGNVKALHDIDFEVRQGELFGLIGPDGAGKTSLMRILATLILPDAGNAFIDKVNVVKNYKIIRNEIGYMPGKFSLYQDLSVEENLSFFATIFGTSIEDNYELIRPIYQALEPFCKRRAGALSGGMKQKLALCCALIHRPKVLILDEPTTGVDAVSRKEFWEILKSLKQYGITIFVSTPYMDEATLCERVALIQNGKILQIETPQQIVANFPHQIFAVHSADNFQLLQDLQEWKTLHSVYPFGYNFHLIDTRSSCDITNELQIYLTQRGHSEIACSLAKPTIEDCFMELLKDTNSIE